MRSKQDNPFPFKGLTSEAVHASRGQYGSNEVRSRQENPVWKKLLSVVSEPMFIILVVSAILYYTLGEIPEAIFMLAAILFVAAISIYQDSRSRSALAALRTLTAPRAKVIRNDKVLELPSKELVVGDLLVVEEGYLIAADAAIIQSNDFAVNESILTGESFPVSKVQGDQISKGTLAVGGLAVGEVTAVGAKTALGKIGQSMERIEETRTPLQVQIDRFVKQMALAGGLVFLLVWFVNYSISAGVLDSLLKALTLAMSILPEEIPVAFTTFMALGAWRLMQKGIIVRGTQTVETLGAATVICTDKTGTITENRMELASVYVPGVTGVLLPRDFMTNPRALPLIEAAMWASEPIPFDPMEIALHETYKNAAPTDLRGTFRMVHEYPLSGKPPMMTHVFENAAGIQVVAAKGAPEAILQLVGLSPDDKAQIFAELAGLQRKGHRVLAVATSPFTGSRFPEQQQELPFEFEGLVAFYDPPKRNIEAVFKEFYQAGIAVKIITGDNALTTATIARQVNFRGAAAMLEGQQLINMNDQELDQEVNRINVFTRMFPEAKLRIIESLKRSGHIVAMTGDGVNDGPALKAAHIGIAMGKRGTETARQASALILLDDDLGRMVDAVQMGRKIYLNLKKAIQYIISIHIPIILTVTLPLLLGWLYPNIFTPVHVIFLELIMGPTCSIVYENEPPEKHIMREPPRTMTKTFLSGRELGLSVWQGLTISAAALLIYQWAVRGGYEENTVRTLVFITLVMANIFLTLVNRSFYLSVFSTLRYRNRLLQGMIILTVVLLFLLLEVPWLRGFFQFGRISWHQFTAPLEASFVSVIWFEVYKWFKRQKPLPGSVSA